MKFNIRKDSSGEYKEYIEFESYTTINPIGDLLLKFLDDNILLNPFPEFLKTLYLPRSLEVDNFEDWMYELIEKQNFCKSFIEFIFDINKESTKYKTSSRQRLLMINLFTINASSIKDLLNFRDLICDYLYINSESYQSYSSLNLMKVSLKTLHSALRDYDIDYSKIKEINVYEIKSDEDISPFFIGYTYELINAGFELKKCEYCKKYFITESRKGEKYCTSEYIKPNSENEYTSCKELARLNKEKDHKLKQDAQGIYRDYYDKMSKRCDRYVNSADTPEERQEIRDKWNEWLLKARSKRAEAKSNKISLDSLRGFLDSYDSIIPLKSEEAGKNGSNKIR